MSDLITASAEYLESSFGSTVDLLTSALGIDPKEWEKQLQTLSDLRLLKEGWNGEGSIGPGDLIQYCEIYLKNFKLRFPSPSSIVATNDGDVVIDWLLPNGEYYELEISQSLEKQWFIEIPGEQPYTINDLDSRNFDPSLEQNVTSGISSGTWSEQQQITAT